MARILIGLAVVLVFVAGFMLDPAGLTQLAFVCATGGCGVRPSWLAVGLGVAIALWLAMALNRRRNARLPARRKSRAGGRRKPGTAAKTTRPAKARRSPRRKTPAGA